MKCREIVSRIELKRDRKNAKEKSFTRKERPQEGREQFCKNFATGKDLKNIFKVKILNQFEFFKNVKNYRFFFVNLSRFLDYGYNSCMASARGQILRDGDSFEENNEVFYFHNMTVFMNYATNRPIWSLSEKIGFISETLSIPALSFIERSMHKFDENIRGDKQRQSKWTTKLNYAIRAFQV